MNQIDQLEGGVPLTGPAAGAAPAWGLIRAGGADAASFLHSQLTNDIAGLGEADVRLAGYCSAKGRLLASFIVWRDGDEIVLACDPSVLAATLKRLSMFVLRSRCKLSDATAQMAVIGLVGGAAAAALGELSPWRLQAAGEDRLIRLPDAAGLPRGLRIGSVNEQAATLPPAVWRWLDVQSGLPTIEAATADRFVPQMVNYELIGGVSFQKGCYPGQEVVARSQYRGTIKRRMALFEIDGADGSIAGCGAGTEVFDAGDPTQPAGMVVNAAAHPFGGRASALVELKSALLARRTLHLGSAAGALLVRRELPYPLPLDAEQAA